MVENTRRFPEALGMMKLYAVGMMVILALSSGCQKPAATPAPPPPASNPNPLVPTQAQPRLQTIKLWLGAEELTTELALTPEQQRTGMMFRTNMAENEAMLFAFAYPHRAAFWMMNTFVPLSAAYIDPEGTILEIHDLQPQNTNSVAASSDRVQYVLETTQGWFKKHNVAPGTLVRTERGTLAQTFTRR
jgi:uncharacterized protein